MNSYQELEQSVSPLDVIKEFIKRFGVCIFTLLALVVIAIIASIPMFVFGLIFYFGVGLDVADSMFFGFITCIGLVFVAAFTYVISVICQRCYEDIKQDLQKNLEKQNKVELEETPENTEETPQTEEIEV